MYIDISSRVTTWDLRRRGAGGLNLEEATSKQRPKLGITDGFLALRVQKAGDSIELTLMRNGERKVVSFKLQ